MERGCDIGIEGGDGSVKVRTKDGEVKCLRDGLFLMYHHLACEV